MAAAQSVSTLRRIGKSVSRRKDKDNDLYLSIIPEKTEWVAKHDLDMLMLDGYVIPIRENLYRIVIRSYQRSVFIA